MVKANMAYQIQMLQMKYSETRMQWCLFHLISGLLQQ